MKKLFLLALGLLFIGCSKNNDVNPDTEIYVAGYTFNSAQMQVAKFWKNGVGTNLTDGTANAGATGIALSGPSVIISGWDWSNNAVPTQVGKFWVNGRELGIGSTCLGTVAIAANSTDVCVLGLSQAGWAYWRNGNATTIIDTLDFQTTGIAVNNGDVYVSGFTGSLASHQAQCWRNGVLIYTSPDQSVANAVAVIGSDIYLAGFRWGNDVLHTKAAFWKNGSVTELTNSDSNAKANAIFISEGDVYVAGSVNNAAVIWKNSLPTMLTDGTSQAEAKSIAVKNENVYTVGYEGSNPRLWKNGVIQNLSDGNLDGVAVSVAVR